MFLNQIEVESLMFSKIIEKYRYLEAWAAQKAHFNIEFHTQKDGAF
jgi:hypothetical protein